MKFLALSVAALISSATAFAPTFRGSPASTTASTTSLAARKPFISGNWKLNPQTKSEAVDLASNIAAAITSDSPDADVALFVPYVFIEAAQEATGGKLAIGAEGVCPQIQGAFTGAVSASMLQSIGVQWALAGHSERRVVFGETDEYINGQCLKLIELGMSVMLCIGESESEYEQDLAGPVCAVQLKKGLAGIQKEDLSRVAIAYEPVWAIGTGKVATPEIAQSVHAKCRAVLAEMYGPETADATRILYGGSVTPESVDDLMAMPDIDGALVGGASLDAAKFGRIINFQSK
ncbi:triosephosphate isomerase [Phaeodactylum tricornutum CCAP 1055/1]|jgi:triosephosphate isomerase|uniref:Triosephosphate isomerase n=2 Tax=Phaeodactylum tricornutum TaxID=2850 RepID=B7FT67_PHATC|nr:triosephosphate isomerase [Phaeodactylum tricornutum CCAP 1055/1]EEC50917.1 triosephosphate isomerase [Phaeodactylum tricornutum CCAP 1055/1]|eukprot:XP_002178103.1 triosephosphate isomerase [Phaeodactylum tricornutum CCAP 1055/1]